MRLLRSTFCRDDRAVSFHGFEDPEMVRGIVCEMFDLPRAASKGGSHEGSITHHQRQTRVLAAWRMSDLPEYFRTVLQGSAALAAHQAKANSPNQPISTRKDAR